MQFLSSYFSHLTLSIRLQLLNMVEHTLPVYRKQRGAQSQKPCIPFLRTQLRAGYLVFSQNFNIIPFNKIRNLTGGWHMFVLVEKQINQINRTVSVSVVLDRYRLGLEIENVRAFAAHGS